MTQTHSYLVLFVLVLFSGAMVFGNATMASQLPGQPANNISGIVVDESGGAIAGVQVTLQDSHDKGLGTVTTDRDGRFLFPAPSPGKYELRTENSRFESGHVEIEIVQGKSAVALRITLKVKVVQQAVNVTARGEYIVPDSTTATKLDTSLMEVPVSIQVVPQSVLLDQQVIRIDQAVRNVSGVYPTNLYFGQFADQFVIRGFRTSQVLYRDGFRVDTGYSGKHDTANIEQVEILKGPASVLYGRIEPGGLINYVTKKPLPASHYSVGQEFGSYSLYRTTVDATGPIMKNDRVFYRINLAYENAASFREFVGGERWFIAPVLQWDIKPSTHLRVEWDHFDNKTTPDNIGLIAFGNRPLDIPRERNLGEPTDFQDAVENIVALTLSQSFKESWNWTGRYNAVISDERDGGSYGDYVTDDDIEAGILPRTIEGSQIGLAETFDQLTNAASTDLSGKFSTGALKHTLLMGGDYYHTSSNGLCCGINGLVLDDINIFAPVHGVTLGPVDPSLVSGSSTRTKWYGVYLQDQIELPYHFRALAGFRYDNAKEESNSIYGGSNSRDDHISPRVGLLWRPVEKLSLYGSYERTSAPLTALTSIVKTVPCPRNCPAVGGWRENGIGKPFLRHSELFRSHQGEHLGCRPAISQ
ncbi:MAG: TonB-dependent receptor [Terriglobia bacterium]